MTNYGGHYINYAAQLKVVALSLSLKHTLACLFVLPDLWAVCENNPLCWEVIYLLSLYITFICVMIDTYFQIH